MLLLPPGWDGSILGVTFCRSVVVAEEFVITLYTAEWREAL